MTRWLSHFWTGKRQIKSAPATPVAPRDENADLAELAALIERGDTTEAALERMADLLGQSDPQVR